MTGRPSTYSDQLGQEICSRVLMRPLHQVAKDDDMPSESAIYSWLGKHADFAENYARARQLRSYRRYEEVDVIKEKLEAGLIDAGQARVLLDAVKWQTGKENPKVFGDKLELAGSKDAPLTVQVVRLGKDGE